jgi:hypothetical protein
VTLLTDLLTLILDITLLLFTGFYLLLGFGGFLRLVCGGVWEVGMAALHHGTKKFF